MSIKGRNGSQALCPVYIIFSRWLPSANAGIEKCPQKENNEK